VAPATATVSRIVGEHEIGRCSARAQEGRQGRVIFVVDDVVDGEPDDPAEPLRVEQDESSRDAGSVREAVVGE
jgi:hypothetical protein